MAICLSKVRYLLGRGAEKAPFAAAPPPMQALTEAEAAEKFFGNGRDAVVGCLLQMMAPHARHGEAAVAHAEFVSEAEAIALEVCGGRRGGGVGKGVGKGDDDDDDDDDENGDNDDDNDDDNDNDDGEKRDDNKTSDHSDDEPNKPTRSLKDGLLWLRDRLAAMEPTPGARHDVAAELIHLHAHTRRYWVNSSDAAHAGLKAEPIPVRENEVNSYGIGAEGATERVVQHVDKAGGFARHIHTLVRSWPFAPLATSVYSLSRPITSVHSLSCPITFV